MIRNRQLHPSHRRSGLRDDGIGDGRSLSSRVSQQLAQGGLAPAIKARLNHLRRQSLRNAYLALRILEGRDGVRKRLEQHRRSL